MKPVYLISLNQLALTYKVSRDTIREAIRDDQLKVDYWQVVGAPGTAQELRALFKVARAEMWVRKYQRGAHARMQARMEHARAERAKQLNKRPRRVKLL